MVHVITNLFSLFIRFFVAVVIVIALTFGGFIAYRGSRAMDIKDAHGITYWNFVKDRVEQIREKPLKCQELYFGSFTIGILIYPALYTYIGLYPDNLLARHVMPSPLIPKKIRWMDVLETWWSVVEGITWDAWAVPHIPSVLPECAFQWD